MSENKDNGGPAFPNIEINADITGMSLRDYFAAKAMEGLVVSKNTIFYDDTVQKISEVSYRVADAMLKERNK